jgi:hypothetical protein
MPTPKATRSLGSDPTHHGSKGLDWARGLFGWAVAVEKVAVGCELWKKLL